MDGWEVVLGTDVKVAPSSVLLEPNNCLLAQSAAATIPTFPASLSEQIRALDQHLCRICTTKVATPGLSIR